MKIVFIAKFKQVWDEEVIAKAFEANGHEVFRIEEGSEYTNEDILFLIRRQKPDFVLFTKLRIRQPGIALIRGIRMLGIPTISWTFDLLLGHPAREHMVAKFDFLFADYAFITDGGHTEDYEKYGINKHTLRQGIPDEFNYIAKEKLENEIIFVGTENVTFPYRQKLMKFLDDTYGSKFKWIGRANAFEVRGHDLNKLYASSKIVIGDCMYGEDYWSNRIYEVLGRGGFLIFPNIKGIEKDFTPYKHFIPYEWGDFEGLKEKIDYFLIHSKERDTIREAGFEHSKKFHTFSQRCREFIELYERVKK